MKQLLLFLIFLPSVCLAIDLDTPNYTVTITSNCEEGEVTCDDNTYHGVSKRSGNEITLKGSSMHRLCADGITPCQFLGYQFKNGNITYFVYESGLLEVVDNKGKVFVTEQGEWQ
jgi:hypothetical protein